MHTSQTDPGVQGRPNRILIVEDDPTARQVMVLLLSRAGYEATPAGSMDEALQAARESPPQVLVADWLLPDGSGLQLAEQVRVLSPSTAVVFLSGYPCEDLRGEACHLQPAAILQKPVDNEDFRRAIRDALAAAVG